jgi:AraC-like DNA-binding protein
MPKSALSKPPVPGIVCSAYTEPNRGSEQFIEAHGLAYVLAGSLQVASGGQVASFGPGEAFFFRKNQLAKFKKQPLEGEFKAITVVFDAEFLASYHRSHTLAAEPPTPAGGPVLPISAGPLIQAFFASLRPYFEVPITEELLHVKKQEALLLLLSENPGLQSILFDFAEPGKIDLEAFMNQHFRFNVPLSRWAYLTGRSLATFKRDFEKLFHTSPERWLHQKRLQEAYYLLHDQQQKPSEVYLEVGFETIAHFSRSFKQQFGINPSALQRAKPLF